LHPQNRADPLPPFRPLPTGRRGFPATVPGRLLRRGGRENRPDRYIRPTSKSPKTPTAPFSCHFPPFDARCRKTFHNKGTPRRNFLRRGIPCRSLGHPPHRSSQTPRTTTTANRSPAPVKKMGKKWPF